MFRSFFDDYYTTLNKGGYEYNVVVMASAIGLAFVGPGAYVLM